MIRVAILGGTGYGGMELLRFLAGHPEAHVTAVTSRTSTEPVGDVYPHLRGFTDLSFSVETPERAVALARENDVLFVAKPHGISAKETPALLDAAPRVKVIDLSGDFRLRDASQYPTFYAMEHPHPERLKDAVYGLPECGHRDAVKRARLVANPGCHASASILSLWPLARAGLLAGRAAVSSVTGSSGSGAEPQKGTHHPERFANFKAYKPLRHQHLPEVVAALGGGARVDLVAHSAPIARGIHVTAFAPVTAKADAVKEAFAKAYGAEPFVRLVKEPAELRSVVGTNMADVYVTVGDGVACVTVTIDNLGKGMAGTAVQNMNLMMGLPETTGLRLPGAGL